MSVFKGKRILITGGTGSFGQAATKEFLKQGAGEVRVFSRDEEKQLDMQRSFSDKRLSFVIGNVRDIDAVFQATENIDFCYHAAALKIIPVCEEFPEESLKTNLLGTLNVKKACLANRVSKGVFINTDKAVYPINVYGACKFVAEKIWLDKQTCDCMFSSVRYGNVLGSRGSVVPFFMKLIAEKKPLPITDLNMTRFLLTLNEAIKTVVYATEHMLGGEVFVPHLDSCRIVDLAIAMTSKDYPRSLIGVRSGEKIHEILISQEEFRRTINEKSCYVIHKHPQFKLKKFGDYSSDNAHKMSVDQIRNLLNSVFFVEK